VSFEIYDVINFDVTSCCGYCNRRDKAPAVVKMAASMVTINAIDSDVTLINNDDNKAYSIKIQFHVLLKQAIEATDLSLIY